MTKLRTCTAGAIAAASLLILVGCGDDSSDSPSPSTTSAVVASSTTSATPASSAPPATTPESTTAEPTTTTESTTTTTTTTTTTVETTTPEALAPPVPSEGELQGKLQSALNGSANELESGDASSITVVRDRIALLPGYTWSVGGPVSVSGDVLSATLQSCLGQCFPIPLTWKNVEGTWKLSQESQNELVGYAQMAGNY